MCIQRAAIRGSYKQVKMKISGFTIIKNAEINDYPVVESIKSLLPVVDEMIVLVGDSSDNTVQLIESIQDPKIKIHSSIWDTTVRTGGAVLAMETDKAFALISPDSDWAFYIQADEVVHEQDYPAIREACKKYKDDKRVEGLLFKYHHFYGTYEYVGDSRKWYSHEVRIIRKDRSISAYKDAQGFRKGNKKLQVKPVNAHIYHYGWVKSPEQMIKKLRETLRYWYTDETLAQSVPAEEYFDYTQYDSIKMFQGTHPSVMHNRVTNTHWDTKLDPSKKRFSFSKKLLYAIEKLTGKRLFEFRNYRILR